MNTCKNGHRNWMYGKNHIFCIKCGKMWRMWIYRILYNVGLIRIDKTDIVEEDC